MKRLFISLLWLAACLPATLAAADTALATFAGGCFWCMEDEFKHVPGVVQVVSGYTGGALPNPTYEQVSTGTTGHVEAVEVHYDPKQVSYEALLGIFWSNVDPLDPTGQFCDKGAQYRAAIFTHDHMQEEAAERSFKREQARLKTTLAASIRPATLFYPAEAEHQSFAERNRLRYQLYRSGCGRDATLKALSGKK